MNRAFPNCSKPLFDLNLIFHDRFWTRPHFKTQAFWNAEIVSLAKSKSGAVALFKCGRLLARIHELRLVEGYKPLLC